MSGLLQSSETPLLNSGVKSTFTYNVLKYNVEVFVLEYFQFLILSLLLHYLVDLAHKTYAQLQHFNL